MSGALAYKEEYNDHEIINGEIYMMSRPNTDHMQVEGNIYSAFKNYLKGRSCRPFNETDVFLDKNNNVVPDVMIVCNPEIIKKQGIYGTPDLMVEILSPSTARKDKMEKFKLYEKYGVKEYWIVSPEMKSVEVYLLNDGKFELNGVYIIYPDYEWDRLTEQKKAEVQFEIKISLYEDFIVRLEDIFENVT